MKRILLTFSASALAALFAIVGTAGAGTNTSNTPVLVTCNLTGQVCDQSYEATATTTSKLILEFESWDRCNFSVAFYVDGTLVHTSNALAWSDETGEIDVGPVAAGTHALEVRATGVPTETCNTGTLTSWSGRFLVTTNDDPPLPTDDEEEPDPETPNPNPTGPITKAACKDGGWKNFSDLAFKNQGQCVKWVEHQD